jgi:hypothetical protein
VPRVEAMSERDAPLPPERIARRGTVLDPSDPLGSYVRAGREMRSGIESLLGPEWSWENKRVLDFGCGSGRALRHFVEEASTVAEFHGCDVDGPSIGWLRENLCPPMQMVQNGPDPPLPHEAQSFDLIYAWYGDRRGTVGGGQDGHQRARGGRGGVDADVRAPLRTVAAGALGAGHSRLSTCGRASPTVRRGS